MYSIQSHIFETQQINTTRWSFKCKPKELITSILTFKAPMAASAAYRQMTDNCLSRLMLHDR